MKYFKLFVFVVLAYLTTAAFADGFYTEYRAQANEEVSNHPGQRLRVNDTELSLHERWGKRTEATANGLMLIKVAEDLFQMEGAELYLELWGGHPGTKNKRFLPNGRETYRIPEVGTEAKNCTYHYPVIPLKIEHLVRGTNAFQFVCDRGSSGWGHFIIDNASVRCYLKPEHPELLKMGLKNFSANVELRKGAVLEDVTEISLSYPARFEQSILSVEYFGRYLGFDDNGNTKDCDWHGFTYKRKYCNHIGTAFEPPFAVKWQTTMIPSQQGPMAVRARVHLKGGLHYLTEVVDNLTFPEGRSRVEMYKCSSMAVPFTSRVSEEKKAIIELPPDISQIEKAQLWVKIWDGGEGSVKEPFKINGHGYNVISGTANHDVVFTVAEVSREHLRPGQNEISLISDTHHHGIEVLLPGPVLIVRYGDK